jgi:hypothetical protein
MSRGEHGDGEHGDGEHGDSGHGAHGAHPVKEPVGWMDRPDVVKRLFTVFYVIAGLLFLAEFILMGTENHHPHPLEEAMRFFVYPVYGFVSFWFLVLLARPMRKLLIRSEDYYEGGGAYQDGAPDSGAHAEATSRDGSRGDGGSTDAR